MFHSDLAACFNCVPDRFDSLLVTCNSRESALLGPSPISIHYDGNVPGDVPASFQFILEFLIVVGSDLATVPIRFWSFERIQEKNC